MACVVRLRDIIDELETVMDDMPAYLNRNTGEVFKIREEHLLFSDISDEDMARYDDWEKDELAIAKKIINSKDYVRLPSKNEINEWTIMRDFSFLQENEVIREDLFSLIAGKGAFRRFKSYCNDHGLNDQWFQYRRDILKQIAVSWCEAQKVPYLLEEL